jgi:hypothetical protein
VKQELQEWFNENKVKNEMLWENGYIDQFIFVRDNVGRLITRGEDKVFVISTHTSKSILLPVYSIETEGLQIILRNNFYNWKMSVISDTPIAADFAGMFHLVPPVDPNYTGDPLAPVYFEGFPEDLIFGYYAVSDKMKWSAEIFNDYLLYVVIFAILKAKGLIKPFEWNRR